MLSLLWVTKSLLQTGCLIFPLESSCITNLSWVNSDYLLNIENVTVNFSNSYYFGESLKISKINSFPGDLSNCLLKKLYHFSGWSSLSGID